MSEEKLSINDLEAISELLAQQKLAENSELRQDPYSPEPSENPEYGQYAERLHALLERMSLADIAAAIEALAPEDRLLVWNEVRAERGEAILEILSDDIREDLICESHLRNEKTSVTAFELRNGRLNQINVNTPYDLKSLKPIWVDLVARLVDRKSVV